MTIMRRFMLRITDQLRENARALRLPMGNQWASGFSNIR